MTLSRLREMCQIEVQSMGRTLAFAAIAIAAVSVSVSVRADGPNVWYVKASNYGLDGLTGEDEEHAWGTLQQAHDAASAGDTIYVLPGTYDQGSKKSCGRDARLVVSKRLNFVATGRADETFIKGEPSTAAAGWGDDGMRCVCVTSGGYGSTFTGLTLCGGSTGKNSGAPYLKTGNIDSGGAALNCYGDPADARSAAYLVDCVVSNNFGKWGTLYGGTAIRCLIKDNCGSGYGGIVSSACLWNSVVVGGKNATNGRSAVGNSSIVVNSTIAAMSQYGVDDASGQHSVCYNTLFTSIGSTAMRSSADYTNCFVTTYGVYSPATGDFRPVAGMEADGAGLSVYITNAIALPEGIEMKDFNGNPIDLTKETCDVGAVQGAVEPATAAFTLPTETLVNGGKTPKYKTTYARMAEWPKEVVLKPVSENFFSYEFSGKLCGGSERRFLLRDGTFRFLPSPFAGDNIAIAEKTADAEYWCDPAANAETATGAEDAPFRTIQDAITAATNALASKAAVIINLKPGDYREGGEISANHMNRFVVPNTHAFLIRSTQGPAVTTIYGEADSNPPEACYAGCGPNAMRCAVLQSASADTASAVQGVTFADGHSNCTDPTKDNISDRTGGVYLSSVAYAHILDSVVTNCTAVRGGASYYGTFKRCRFCDCVSYGAVFRYGRLDSCLVAPSCRSGDGAAGASQSSVVGQQMEELCCTIPSSSYGSSTGVRSSVLGDQEVKNTTYAGTVFRAPSGVVSSAKNYAIQDPGFADFDGGDFRLVKGTPALDASANAIAALNAAAYGAWVSNVVAHLHGDVDGNALKIIDGKIMPGCFHTMVDGFYVNTPSNGGVAIAGGEFGKVNALGAGDSVTLSPETGTRPCIGCMMNGVTNLFDDAVSGSQITVTPEMLTAAGGGMFAAAIYTKDWYVDPAGNDGRCGFTPKTAKKTLAAAMAMTVSGDTVHAAEGRYEEGVGSTKPSEEDPDSRIFIPSGRSLVADGAAERTFIVGKIGDDDYTNALGCGSNSVRCVYMARNSLLKGFTLTEGRAYPANGGTYLYGAPYNGGAVYGAKRAECLVVDCIITNCAAYNYAAGRECSFIGCRIVGNKATKGITSECYHMGCVIDGNYAGSGTCIYVTQLFDCTLGPNAYNLSGAEGTALGSGSSDAARIANSLILGKCSMDKRDITVSNCVFVAGKVTGTILDNTNNCFVVSEDEVQVDGDLRPIAGKNVACDIADPSIGSYVDESLFAPYLASMRERANNGCKLDAGALEADWTGRYAQDIGGSFTVVSADKAVEESAQRTVLVPEGAAVEGYWRNAAGRSLCCTLRFIVPEGGSLSVNAAGNALAFGEGTHEYRFASPAEMVMVAFESSAGTAEILKCSRYVGSTVVFR